MGGREGRRGVPRPPRAPCTQDLACSQEGAGGRLWSPGGCDRHRDGTGPTSPPLCWVPGLAKVHDPLSHSKAHLKDSSCSLRGSKCLRLTPHTRVLTDDDKAQLAPPPPPAREGPGQTWSGGRCNGLEPSLPGWAGHTQERPNSCARIHTNAWACSYTHPRTRTHTSAQKALDSRGALRP